MSNMEMGNVVGSPTPGTVKGTTRLFSPTTAKMYGSVTKYYLQTRLKGPSLVEIVREGLKGLDLPASEIRQAIMEAARDDHKTRNAQASDAEIQAFVQTVEGYAYLTWLRLRPNHPEVTLESWQETMEAMTEEDLANLSAEIDESLGNSTGPNGPKNSTTSQSNSAPSGSEAAESTPGPDSPGESSSAE